MSILLVLLMFLLVLTISCFRRRQEQPLTAARQEEPSTRAARESGLEIPDGYWFHLCHTWVAYEGQENARVGLDSFVANLLGDINHVEVTQPNRWVRQGQKLMTVSGAGVSVELLSPVEGGVKMLNQAVLSNPTLVITDPYKDGWIVLLKSPDIAIDQKNLINGRIAKSWMRNNFARLNEMVSRLSPALAQDGGTPLRGLLAMVSPELQRKLIKEFLLTEPVPRTGVTAV